MFVSNKTVDPFGPLNLETKTVSGFPTASVVGGVKFSVLIAEPL
jgi:hypothetical protein